MISARRSCVSLIVSRSQSRSALPASNVGTSARRTSPGILLWVAPASNLLSLIYTGSILGAQMVWIRVLTALAMAFVVGWVMTLAFKQEEMQRMNP